MVICYILGCKSRSERRSENVTFHSFPKNSELCEVWIRASGRQNWKPTKYTRICSRHFEKKWLRKTDRKTYLHAFAVPTLHIVQQVDGSCFNAKEKNLIVNVYKNVKNTWPTDQLSNEKLFYHKTASILGISIISVNRILKEYESNGSCKFRSTSKMKLPLSDRIDKLTKSAIRRKVHSYYMNGEIPTMNKIFQAANADENIPNLKPTTFKKILDHLKFQYVKRHRDYALIDKEDVCLSRGNYLKKIKEYRKQKRCIYYLDEMWLHAGNSAGSKNTNATTKCMVVVHIGNENGFVEDGLGVFSITASPNHDEEIKAKEFENWFERILPKLDENTLVVMDDTPYHSRTQGKSPKMGWQKNIIQDWLRNKRIDYKEDNYKVELLKKVKEVLAEHQLYWVDEMAKRRNIEVLRLPPYHNDLNPIKVIWADIKTNMSKYNAVKIERLKTLVEQAIEKLPVERWPSAVQEVVELEDNFYSKIDGIMDDAIDRYLIYSDNDSSISSGESTVTCASSDSEAD